MIKSAFVLISLFFLTSCGKEMVDQDSENTSRPYPIALPPSTASTIPNPIVGEWEIGVFKTLCKGSTDTVIYPNENGNNIAFSKNDTAYYTYIDGNGWSPYKILDSTTFILADTCHIISYDGSRLTTYSVTQSGANQQWMTYVRKEIK